jgi:hypothetical protein
MRHKYRDIAQRLWERVNKEGPVPLHCPELGPCWVWTGRQKTKGYGRIQAPGRNGRNLYAHRVSWEIANGRILIKGEFVCHHCDTRACVRPSHMFLSDHLGNMADMVSKGRSPETHPFGDTHHSAKLNAVLVKEARQRYAAGGITTYQLAIEYGVSPNTMQGAINRRTWKHVA